MKSKKERKNNKEEIKDRQKEKNINKKGKRDEKLWKM